MLPDFSERLWALPVDDELRWNCQNGFSRRKLDSARLNAYVPFLPRWASGNHSRQDLLLLPSFTPFEIIAVFSWVLFPVWRWLVGPQLITVDRGRSDPMANAEDEVASSVHDKLPNFPLNTGSFWRACPSCLEGSLLWVIAGVVPCQGFLQLVGSLPFSSKIHIPLRFTDLTSQR